MDIYIHPQYIEYIVKNIPTKKTPGPYGFSAEYNQTFSEETYSQYHTY